MREAPDRQRAEAPRVAHGDDLISSQDDERECTLPGGERSFDPLLPGLTSGSGEHQGEHLGVTGCREAEPLVQQLVAQGRSIDNVAVMRDRERAVHCLDEEGLDVPSGVGTSGGVPGVANRVIAGQRRQCVRREDIGDEASFFVQPGALAVTHGDAGGFLPAMLQGEEPEKCQLSNTFAMWGRQPKHAALVFGLVVSERTGPRGSLRLGCTNRDRDVVQAHGVSRVATASLMR